MLFMGYSLLTAVSLDEEELEDDPLPDTGLKRHITSFNLQMSCDCFYFIYNTCLMSVRQHTFLQYLYHTVIILLK